MTSENVVINDQEGAPKLSSTEHTVSVPFVALQTVDETEGSQQHGVPRHDVSAEGVWLSGSAESDVMECDPLFPTKSSQKQKGKKRGVSTERKSRGIHFRFSR